jgi:hypothetical protein
MRPGTATGAAVRQGQARQTKAARARNQDVGPAGRAAHAILVGAGVVAVVEREAGQAGRVAVVPHGPGLAGRVSQHRGRRASETRSLP